MTNTAAYLGRKIDLLAWRGGRSNGEVKLKQNLADVDSPSGEICTGIQKLAQRWLTKFMRRKGTAKCKPTEGTYFMGYLQQGIIRTEADLRAVFALSELDAREQLLAEETASDPDDERYTSATLTNVTVYPGFAKMTVVLKSRAATATFIVPIPIVV